jgi:hypothetical protein
LASLAHTLNKMLAAGNPDHHPEVILKDRSGNRVGRYSICEMSKI